MAANQNPQLGQPDQSNTSTLTPEQQAALNQQNSLTLQNNAGNIAYHNASAPTYGDQTAGAQGLTNTQSTNALNQYAGVSGNLSDVQARYRQQAAQGMYSPQELARQETASQAAQYRTGAQSAQNAVNNNAGGGSNVLLGSAITSQAAGNAAYAGQQAASDLEKQNAQARLDALTGLSGTLGTDASVASNKANISANTADEPGRDSLLDSAYQRGAARTGAASGGGTTATASAGHEGQIQTATGKWVNAGKYAAHPGQYI